MKASLGTSEQARRIAKVVSVSILLTISFLVATSTAPSPSAGRFGNDKRSSNDWQNYVPLLIVWLGWGIWGAWRLYKPRYVPHEPDDRPAISVIARAALTGLVPLLAYFGTWGYYQLVFGEEAARSQLSSSWLLNIFSWLVYLAVFEWEALRMIRSKKTDVDRKDR